MDNIDQQVLLKLLVESDDFKYMYDERNVLHNDPNAITNFYSTFQHELKKHGVYKDVADLKKFWRKIREKFCKINLQKIRQVKTKSVQSEIFYKNFIFLEDYISHKNEKVYITQNKKEIIDDVYNKIMEIKYVEDIEHLPNDTLLSKNEDDISSNMYNEYEHIDILEGYEDIVETNLIQEKIKSIVDKNSNKVNEEKSICTQMKDSPSTQASAIGLKSNVTALKTKPSKVFPLTSEIAPLKATNKLETRVGSCRAKYDQIMDDKKKAIATPIIAILNQAISEKESMQVRNQVLQVILNSIKFFCKNHGNN